MQPKFAEAPRAQETLVIQDAAGTVLHVGWILIVLWVVEGVLRWQANAVLECLLRVQAL